MKRIIINGANGYVASNFIKKLIAQDYEVIALVRGNSKFSAKQRMLNALEEMSNGEKLKYENLKVYNYALLEEDFSMSQEQLRVIFNKKAYYYHFAASLKFSEKTKDEIFKTNINGVNNSINLFLKYATKNSQFFFISTAYSCGKTSSIFKEEFYKNKEITSFRNYYEQSKRFAENLIRKNIDDNGLNAHILRPSQVVGNNITGITKTDFGVFDFMKRLSNLAYKYPNETVRIKVNPDATQNLIPINTIANYLIATITKEELPTIINFVAKQPIKNSDIINCIGNMLPIKIISTKQLDKNLMTPIERLIDIGMSFTGEYSDTNIHFDTKNLDKIITTKESEITKESLQQMLDYFANNFLKERILSKVS